MINTFWHAKGASLSDREQCPDLVAQGPHRVPCQLSSTLTYFKHGDPGDEMLVGLYRDTTGVAC
jgi:hypothetical protein